MVLKTELCRFSGAEIYPGRGRQIHPLRFSGFLFLNFKCKRYFHKWNRRIVKLKSVRVLLDLGLFHVSYLHSGVSGLDTDVSKPFPNPDTRFRAFPSVSDPFPTRFPFRYRKRGHFRVSVHHSLQVQSNNHSLQENVKQRHYNMQLQSYFVSPIRLMDEAITILRWCLAKQLCHLFECLDFIRKLCMVVRCDYEPS